MGIGNGGLSADERRDLFSNFARDLDARQLERVYQSLGSESRQGELLDAISRHSSDAVKSDLVARLADQTTDRPYDFNAGWFSSRSNRWDSDAVAVGQLLASMTSATTFRTTLAALNDPQLEAVMSAGIRETATTYYMTNGVPSTSFDTAGLTALIETTARLGSTVDRARVFELASRQIDAVRESDSLLSPNLSADRHAGEIADALSTLLDSNTNGIVTALERNDALPNTRAGNGMSSYMAELVRQGDIEQIQAIIARLQIGNSLPANGDAVEFLSRFTVDSQGARNYQNASNLGYIVGSVREGIQAIESDAQQQADMLKTIFGSALGLGSVFIPSSQTFVKAAAALTRSLSSDVIQGISDDLVSGDLALADAIEALAVPREIGSSDVTNSIDSAIEAVIRN
ncbi:MAG: hypothetical protein WBD20_03285 [Pirellulaceae bacterium]